MSNVRFQIGFNSEIITGSLEFNKEQIKFFASSKHDSSSPDETVRSFDLINTFSFPVIIYNVVLSDQASKFFKVHATSSKFVHLQGSGANSTFHPSQVPVHKSAFKLTFNRKKFLTENAKHLMNRSQKVNAFLGKASILTNFSKFDIPLFIDDGLLQFVSFV